MPRVEEQIRAGFPRLQIKVRCAGCRRAVYVEPNRMDHHRTLCPDCGEKLRNGELDKMTFYDGK